MSSSSEPEREPPIPPPEEGVEPPPRELFRRIQKRDGRIVDFNREKVTEAIWAAARSVGGRDRSMAELLTDHVILYLGRLYDDHLLTIEEVQDAVEKVLIEQGHARTSKAFILYRERRARERAVGEPPKDPAAQPTLFRESPITVQTSRDKPVRWDRKCIVEALVHETSLPVKFAETISREIEKEIIHGGLRVVTAPLIREMVNCKLVEHGLESERRQYTRLGIGLADVERFFAGSGELAGRRYKSPALSDRALAGELQRQYAFLAVLPEDVTAAHLAGDIFIHHLDRAGALHHGVHSVEYVKRYGLDFPGYPGRQQPPGDLFTLLHQVSSFSRSLREHFAAGISWPWFNIFLSPMAADTPDEVLQGALRSFLFDLGAHPEGTAAPPVYLDLALRALEPPGRVRSWARDTTLFGAVLDAIAKGDDRGQPFPGVEARIYLGEEAWREEGADLFWESVLSALSRKVTMTLLFQRGKSLHLPGCTRLVPGSDRLDQRDIAHPWKMRYATWSQVTVNLPRVALMCAGNEDDLAENLGRIFRLAAVAASEKRAWSERIFHQGARGPMGFLSARKDGEPYLRRTGILVGAWGLTEAARILAGDPRTEDTVIRRLEGRMVEHLYLLARKFGGQNGLPTLICQDHGAPTATHFQRIRSGITEGDAPKVDDRQLRLFTEATSAWDRGIDVGNRVLRKGMFHDFMEGGALIPVPWDDIPQDARNFRGLLHRCFRDTRALGIRIEAPVTVCEDCGIRSRGRHDLCPACQSANVR
jgi:ribonucleoside-triphosphate reductase